MAEYRFFGTETILPGNISLSRYGQTIELEPEAANELIAADPPALLIPAELWDGIFLPGADTDAELAKWPFATIHATVPSAATNAPPDFLEKTSAVRKAYHEYRQDLKAAKPAAAVTKPAPISEI